MRRPVFYVGLIVFVLIGGSNLGPLSQKGLRVLERGDVFYSTDGTMIRECNDCLDSNRNLKMAHTLGER